MGSLSLPKVLNPRKTSLEIERENFEKNQAISINKAINQLETPVKEKHVRQAIIGTFQDKGALTFWNVAARLALQENRIVAWKFCHVLHKILREGHPNCLVHSQRYQPKLEGLGKLWVHLKEGYGKLIQLYCSLLITKLEFHKRNPKFPGNLSVTNEELESIGENDINIYFQMSVEMFDFMDDILALQTAIFGCLDMSKSNSMQSSGQCRLAPLIPCIQDAAQLYDLSVKILFKLHSTLPSDVLDGHRKRFLKQFRDLKQFYQTTRTLQYFRTLITIPSLPENPPNFLIQAELRTYVTPVVILPPEEPEPDLAAQGQLIDTSEDVSPDRDSLNGSISPTEHQNLTDLITERDNMIYHIQQQLSLFRKEKKETEQVLKENRKTINALHEKISTLEIELATQQSELVQERQLKEDLFNQASTVAQTQDVEQKSKEEKFNKLKAVYTKLREEHIVLIRQKAEVDKQFAKLSCTNNSLETKSNELEAKIKELQEEHQKEIDNIHSITSTNKEEFDNIKSQLEYLQSENRNLKAKVDWVLKEKNELDKKYEDLLKENNDFTELLKTKDTCISELHSNISEVNKKHGNTQNNSLNCILNESQEILHHAISEVDNPAISVSTCGPDYFLSLIPNARSNVDSLFTSASNESDINALIQAAIRCAHYVADVLIQGKATSNISTNIIYGEQMADECKLLGKTLIDALKHIQNKEDASTEKSEIHKHFDSIVEHVNTISGDLKGDSAENLADLVDSELIQMDKAIEEAAKKIEEMLNKSREADSGIKLEVNEKILDSCTTLMQAIKVLVQKSRLLQAEIVARGKSSTSVKEFYKRNHRWTEGLLSAAKAVGSGAKFLLSAADRVVSGQGKFEQLMVGAQEIAASTAQLVVASRVKADRNSANLTSLSTASKAVTNATGQVVATAKSCSQLIEENDEIDTSEMNLLATKRQEMEVQVHILELEQTLQHERLKLASLRKLHYQLAGDQEGWDIIEKP